MSKLPLRWVIKVTEENKGIINSNPIPNYYGYIGVGKYLHSTNLGCGTSPVDVHHWATYEEINISQYKEILKIK